jgi:hypothetical protein
VLLFPKFQAHDETVPVEVSVNFTVSGKHPEVTSAVKDAVCARHWTATLNNKEQVSKNCFVNRVDRREGFVILHTNGIVKLKKIGQVPGISDHLIAMLELQPSEIFMTIW